MKSLGATTTVRSSPNWGNSGPGAGIACTRMAALTAGVKSAVCSLGTAVLLALALPGSFCRCVAQEALLRTAAEVQRLSPEDARQHRQVSLRGVITFAWNTAPTEFTIEDPTGAVWFPATNLPLACRRGTEVEVEGTTDSGVFGPFVRVARMRPLGPGTLPAARRVSLDELPMARHHGRRVEVTGIVRGQRVNPVAGLDWLALEISNGSGRVTVNLTHETVAHPELIDTEVRILGVNLHSTDAQQLAFLPMINAQSLADVEVITPANPRPFAQPPTRLDNLMRSAGTAGAGHRVHMRGVVTFVSRQDWFYFQDESRGIRVSLREPLRPTVGEVVDVVGFPEPGTFSPIVRDAEWRSTGERRSPPAPLVSLEEGTKHDGRIIMIQGTLLEVTLADRKAVLTLEQGTQRCRVYVLDVFAQQWTEGSILRVTGVSTVATSDWESIVARRQPPGFSLLVPNPQGVTQIQPAPWWTPTRAAWLITAVAAILCCSIGTVWLQTRKRLREDVATRAAAQAQFSAVLGERNRIAREIHDTLAQGFTGISAQLEVLNDRLQDAPASLRQHLDLARELVRSSLDEARRSVWNLRAQALAESGLGDVLDRLGRQLTVGGGAAFETRIDGCPRPLPVDVENNLLRIGQEAITNAVRHAGAKRISLGLEYLPDSIRLVVSDDGKGFDPSQIRPSSGGGFGLHGIRERAEAMHATLRIIRCAGGGTNLDLLVPHV